VLDVIQPAKNAKILTSINAQNVEINFLIYKKKIFKILVDAFKFVIMDIIRELTGLV